ncbi:hypothetical protein INT45_014288 [Circinella minor]|uniref:F-box domain-containing protein n=1 Tax=Circinella minor TaxID=1195481 RepID=A0A8H7SA73_9FUNG|nr:hypothetical protein INT45_014288 [Circinella minor]
MTKKPTDIDPSILPPMRLTPLAASFLKLAESVDGAINNRDYDSTINYTTCTIDQLDIQQLLMVLLDTRAYSYAMQGQMDLAIADTHKMMSYPSMLPNGYLRKADILKMYGKLQEAIQAYNDGLMKTSPEEEKNKPFILQLKNGLKEARIQNKEPVDFISKLPSSIVNNNIMPHLQQSTKQVSLKVSRVWRNKILNHRDTWKNLVVDDKNQETLRVFNIIPSMEYNIEQLSVITGSSTISTNTDIQQELLNTATVPIAFWQTRQTLTVLDLDFGANTSLIKLADLVMTCTNLTKLSFTTTQSLDQLVGNFSVIGLHGALSDIQIKAKLITGQDIEPMLQQCHQIRRLVMNTCDETIFDVITRQGDSLEILGYNPNYDITELQTKSNRKNRKGLQKLYTNNGGTYISAKKILPLLYKNRTTLTTLHAMIASVTEKELWELYSTYPDFELGKIKSLRFWSKPGIQQFMLRAIRNTTTLEIFIGAYLTNGEELVTTLKGLPILSEFSWGYINDIESRPSLFHLFEHYRLFSMTNNTQQPTLRYVNLHNSDAISDDLLLKVTTVKTFHKLRLGSLKNISSNGFNRMISKLDDQLTWLWVEKMDIITDNIIAALGNLKKLNYLKLISLKNVTNQGIYGLLDTVNSSILTKLVIDHCPNITKSCIATAKQRIKVVKHIY